MKIKTPYFIIEFEVIFLIVFFSFILSNEIKKILFSFYLCYLFIIFHELSHMLIGVIFGKEIKIFKFTLSGVNISFSKYYMLNKFKEILIYLAGPISNIFLAIIFSYNKMIFEINICLAIINLLPIFPLDGYNIIYNLLRDTKLEKSRKCILKILYIVIFTLLILLAIIELFMYKNISILIFFIYIILIYFKSNNVKNNTNIDRICILK